MLKSVPDAWHEIIKENMKAIIITKRDLCFQVLLLNYVDMTGHSLITDWSWLLLCFWKSTPKWSSELSFGIWECEEVWSQKEAGWEINSGEGITWVAALRPHGLSASVTGVEGGQLKKWIDSVKSYVTSNPLFFYPHLEILKCFSAEISIEIWPVLFLRQALCLPHKSKAGVLNPVWGMLSLHFSHAQKQALAAAEITWVLYSLHIQQLCNPLFERKILSVVADLSLWNSCRWQFESESYALELKKSL